MARIKFRYFKSIATSEDGLRDIYTIYRQDISQYVPGAYWQKGAEPMYSIQGAENAQAEVDQLNKGVI